VGTPTIIENTSAMKKLVPGNGNYVSTGLWFLGSGTGGAVKLFKKLRIMFTGNKGWRTEVKS